MDAKVLLATLIGFVAGSAVFAVILWPRERPFTTVAECVLDEMAGRQASMLPFATRACTERRQATLDFADRATTVDEGDWEKLGTEVVGQ